MKKKLAAYSSGVMAIVGGWAIKKFLHMEDVGTAVAMLGVGWLGIVGMKQPKFMEPKPPRMFPPEGKPVDREAGTPTGKAT